MRKVATILAVAALVTLCGCNQPQEQTMEPGGLQPLSASEQQMPDGPQPAASPVPLDDMGGLPVVEPAPAPAPAVVAAPPEPPASAARTYVIQPGDNFYKISRTLFGSNSRAKEIQALNPGLDPTKLQVGQTINVPAQ